MDDEIMAMFVEDTKENLASIETDLLDLEEAGDDFDPELINRVFRTAHSIKGAAGFLALNAVRDLAHKIENVLDLVRNGELTPNRRVVDAVLAAFDRLADLVDAPDHGAQGDIAAHVETLTSLLTESLPPEQQQSLATSRSLFSPEGRLVFETTEYDLIQARKGGNNIYIVEYDLIHDVHKKDKTPLDMMQFLEKSGRIIDCKVDLAAVGDLSMELSNRIPFYILYATILEEDLVKTVFQVSPQFIHEVPDNGDAALHAVNAAAARAVDRKDAPRLTSGPGLETVDDAELDSMEAAFDKAAREYAERARQTRAGHALQLDDTPPPASSGEPTTQAADCLALEGKLTIERAGELREQLLRALDSVAHGDVLALRFEEVESVDLSFLQLLWAAYRSAQTRGVTVSVQSLPAPLVAASVRAGFADLSPESVDIPEFPLIGVR